MTFVDRLSNHKSAQQNHHQMTNTNQTYQQRATNQLQTINEILSKTRSTVFSQLQRNQDQKVFPEDPPPQPKPEPQPQQQKSAATSNSNNDMKALRVTLNRLQPEHIEQMSKSVSEFAKTQPQSAKDLGVIKSDLDIFSLIKAEDRNLKRKTGDNSCPCKCLFDEFNQLNNYLLNFFICLLFFFF